METNTTPAKETEQDTELRRRRLQGVVQKAAMQDTVTVLIERLFPHPRFKRVMRRSRKYLVHDPEGIASVGDTVMLEETRPISKRKRWRVISVVQEAPKAELGEDEDEEVASEFASSDQVSRKRPE